MAAVAQAPTALAGQGTPFRNHSSSSSPPNTTERMASRKLFGRSRKPPPSELASSRDNTALPTNGGYSPYKDGYGSNNDSADDKVFSRRSTNHSSSALSTASTASRTSRFFRRFARPKPPPVPSLPPALVLDLDAGTAVPRSSSTVTPVATRRGDGVTPDQSQAPTAAAAIIAESNAAYAAAESIPRPKGIQRKKMLEAVANARLDVAQTRDLVRLCGLQIRERGLDTPGLFRPFRIAESADHVYHMIQLFLLSIDVSTYIAVFPILPDNALDRLGGDAGSTTSSQEAKSKIAREELDKELRYASPHDIASVMKWGLRHMRMRTSDFSSKDTDEWYDVFVAAERESGYHARAIADLLHPKLPQATAELLSEVLDLMASVAAHASSNHMPASALCRMLGFWILGRIGVAHPPPTVSELVDAVNKAAAMAEHLLLAHIRSQAAVTFSMPLRLTELVQPYPYIKPEAMAPSLPPVFASRPVPTLRIDLRSDNLIVSQAKPRSPSAILADALDASAAESLKGDHGEMWAAIMTHVDHLAEEGTKGSGLLIDEHVRILRQVDRELGGLKEAQHEESGEKAALLSEEARASRRRSQSLSDLRSGFAAPGTRPLAPLLEAASGSNGTTTPTTPRASGGEHVGSSAPKSSTPKRKAVPLLKPGESERMEVVADACAPPAQTRHGDLFSGELEPSASWWSFSEEGFGGMSTASSELSLSDFDLRPSGMVQTLPSRRSQRSLYRARSSASNGSRGRAPAVPSASTGNTEEASGRVEGGPKPIHTVTAATLTSSDTAFAILWQDQLLDPSPCCKFPPLVFVQLNTRTADQMLSTGDADEEKDVPRYPGDTPWLMIAETIVPPRPPTPPAEPHPSGRKSGRRWGAETPDDDRRSIFAPSIKSVRMRLRRVSTVIGSGMGRRTKVNDENMPTDIQP